MFHVFLIKTIQSDSSGFDFFEQGLVCLSFFFFYVKSLFRTSQLAKARSSLCNYLGGGGGGEANQSLLCLRIMELKPA